MHKLRKVPALLITRLLQAMAAHHEHHCHRVGAPHNDYITHLKSVRQQPGRQLFRSTPQQINLWRRLGRFSRLVIARGRGRGFFLKDAHTIVILRCREMTNEGENNDKGRPKYWILTKYPTRVGDFFG